MKTYKFTAMQQASLPGIKKLLKNAKLATTYQASVFIDLIRELKKEGVVTILHWTHSTKNGWQRIEDEKHIMEIAQYILTPNSLTPQNIIFSIRKNSFMKFVNKFEEVGILEINGKTIITVLDGQHRISAFILILDTLEQDIQGLKESLQTGEPYQISKLLVDAGYDTGDAAETLKVLEEIYQQFITYKISCNFISNLTEQQEIDIFLNLNTKGKKLDRGLADHLKIALGQVNNVKEFAYSYIEYVQKTPTNIFHEFIKPVNTKATTGTITETSFSRSLNKTKVVSQYVAVFANKDYANANALQGFASLMDEFWLALRDTMPDAFDINQQKEFSLIRSAGMEAFNALLAKMIANQHSLSTHIPKFELGYAFFRSCFDRLKKQKMGYTQQDNWVKGGYSAKSFGSSANKCLADDMWEIIKTDAFNYKLKINSKYVVVEEASIFLDDSSIEDSSIEDSTAFDTLITKKPRAKFFKRIGQAV